MWLGEARRKFCIPLTKLQTPMKTTFIIVLFIEMQCCHILGLTLGVSCGSLLFYTRIKQAITALWLREP